jgi:serine/threonine-protein kinase
MVADRYALEREIARGGMGTVWLARDTKLGRAVAIKVMAQELAQVSESLARFEREAKAVAALNSQHVVQVFDYGVQQGLPFIVMELLQGESLSQRLKREGRIPLADTARLVSQMCKGLKAAHGAGLVHRDIKPSNIFLARHDDAVIVKLLDFGVVKAVDQHGKSDSTMSGMLLGTPQYMSPEQARATKKIDHRSDLWSVAVIVYRMLAGTNPFQGESVGDVVLKICSDTLPKITKESPDPLPVELDGFFEKAFGRSPDERFQSAEDMAAVFHDIVVKHLPEGALPGVSLPGALRSDAGLPPAPEPAAAGEEARTVSSSSRLVALTPDAARAVLPSLTQTPTTQASSEPTPHSTTVGGTPLASRLPPAYLARWRSRPALALGAGAAVLLGGVVAVLLARASTPEPLGHDGALANGVRVSVAVAVARAAALAPDAAATTPRAEAEVTLDQDQGGAARAEAPERTVAPGRAPARAPKSKPAEAAPPPAPPPTPPPVEKSDKKKKGMEWF